MLFAYTYVPHKMEKMQEYIDFIFYEVWCEAKGKEYDVDKLFAGNDELKQIIVELHTSEVKGADFFLKGMQLIFEDFKGLDDKIIENLKHWYHSNNNVELVCAADPVVTPVTYVALTNISSDLSDHFKSFYQNLYSQSFLSLKSISSRIGEINNHYSDFMDLNNEGKCPFCGINNLRGNYHSRREAYDHFLPKDKYPFNTINFHNLAPACNECNSSYKLSRDPLFISKNPLSSNAGNAIKAFYPYQVNDYEIELGITLTIHDWLKITPDDIKLEVGPNELNEELNAWLEVYGIEERYSAMCCGKNDGLGWIREILDESKNYGLTPQDFLQGRLETAVNKPWVDNNFLRRPFLDACNRAGLFNVSEND